MENQPPSGFGPFLIDVRERLLLRDGEPVPLTPKAFDLLAALVAQPGRLFTKDELLQRVWPDTFVEESNLAYHVFALRKALGDTAGQARYIETVPKRGYRFKGPVTPRSTVIAGPATATDGPPAALEPAAAADSPALVPSDPHAPAVAATPDPEAPRRTWPLSRRRAAVASVLLLAAVGYAAVAWRRAAREPAPLRAVPLTSLTGAVRVGSFSPDGAHLAFTWSGETQENPDVYVQQIGAGPPLRVTTHPGNDYGPSWSPDGRTIAFLRRAPDGLGSEVRLVAPLGGTERKLADVRPRFPYLPALSLAWCPDSTCIVVTDSPGDGQWDALFAVSLDTGEKRQLTRPEREVDVNPAVSPDGRSLVFFRRDPTSFSGAFHRLPLGERMAPGDPVRLTGPVRGGKPVWTPDGREILFASRRALWRFDALKGGTPARVPSVEDSHDVAVSRTAGGQERLVYARGVVDANIWRIDVPAPGAAAVSPPVAAIASTRTDSTADLSPDGQRLAFVSDRSGDVQIWIAHADGTGAVQLTSEAFVSGFAFPRWSPGGDQIVFDAAVEGPRTLFIVPLAGSRARVLSPTLARAAAPRYSRDGRWIYFAKTDERGARIWKVPSQGGAAAQVTAGAGSVPVESRDGRDLYYVDSIERPSALWRQPLAGGQPVRLLDGVVLGAFALVDAGIYYIDRPLLPPGGFVFDRPAAEARLQYFDFGTRQSTTVARNLGNVGFGLTASPDGRAVFFSRLDSVFDELMLVDDFR